MNRWTGLLAVLLFLFMAAEPVRAQQPIVLSADGPATACAGALVSFTFRFEVNTSQVEDGLGSFVMPQPAHTSYVALEPLPGTVGAVGHNNIDPALADTHSFSSKTSAGAVRLTVRTEPQFDGTVQAVALILGTGTAASNKVSTRVAPCAGELPATGTGNAINREEHPPVGPVVALGLAGLLMMGLAEALRRVSY